MGPANKLGKLGKTQRMTAETKADVTKKVSLEISRTEAEQRRFKTEKLRAARLALQEEPPRAEPKANRKGSGKKLPKA